MTTNDKKPPRGPGRPRDPGSREAIEEATLKLLNESGYQGLTMAGVAKHAGVAKTTIYRRWPTKAEMVLDAVAEEFEIKELDSTGDVLVDLRNLMGQFYKILAPDPSGAVSITATELLGDPELAETFSRRFVHPTRERARALVERGIDQERLRDDLDPYELVDILMGPAIYRPVTLRTRAEADVAGRIFDVVMKGALSHRIQKTR